MRWLVSHFHEGVGGILGDEMVRNARHFVHKYLTARTYLTCTGARKDGASDYILGMVVVVVLMVVWLVVWF